MRTREEQAKSLRDSLCANYVSAPVHGAGYELAMRHIEEAERRAEACVRAEIVLDSERLNWISRTPDFFFELLQDQPGDAEFPASVISAIRAWVWALRIHSPGRFPASPPEAR